jgi:hypothetical protein
MESVAHCGIKHDLSCGETGRAAKRSTQLNTSSKRVDRSAQAPRNSITAMGDIISIDNKLALAKEKRELLDRKRKIQAVRKIFQCTQCAYKCEKCGTQIAEDTPETGERIRDLRVPYRLCEGCAEEYIDYIERHKGGGERNAYWRNDAWMAHWRSWIDYQASIDRYMKSKEFLMLLQELRQKSPEE